MYYILLILYKENIWQNVIVSIYEANEICNLHYTLYFSNFSPNTNTFKILLSFFKLCHFQYFFYFLIPCVLQYVCVSVIVTMYAFNIVQ